MRNVNLEEIIRMNCQNLFDAINSTYSVYSKFDLEKHMETFINYLEVVISPDGVIEYAVPSHQEKLIYILMKQRNMTRDEVLDSVPEDWRLDFNQWLMKETGYIQVWSCGYMCECMTPPQLYRLDEFVKNKIMLDKEMTK